MKFKRLNERKEQFKKFEKQWLNESSMDMLSTKEWLDEMGVKNYTINRDGTVDVDGDVFIEERKLTSIPIQFGVVTGYFTCSSNLLTSLEGCPRSVGRSFYCGNNLLTSLEGCPKIVGGVFNCSDNQLTSLEGAPEKIPLEFDCSYNQLTSLEGAPEKVRRTFICHHNQLTSLEGCPKEMSSINLTNNPISRKMSLNDVKKYFEQNGIELIGPRTGLRILI